MKTKQSQGDLIHTAGMWVSSFMLGQCSARATQFVNANCHFIWTPNQKAGSYTQMRAVQWLWGGSLMPLWMASGLCVIKKRWGLDTLKAVSDLKTTSCSWEAFQELQGYWTSTLHLQVLGLNVTSAVLNRYLEVTHKVRCRLKTAYKYSGSGMIVWNCAWLPPNRKILL